MTGVKLTFGGYLRKLREERGWSLRDVEAMTGGKVSNAALSQLETGKVAAPSFITVHRLASVFGVSLESLAEYAEVGAPPEPPPCCPTCGRPYTDAGRATLSQPDRAGGGE